jgi:hypothetical protein
MLDQQYGRFLGIRARVLRTAPLHLKTVELPLNRSVVIDRLALAPREDREYKPASALLERFFSAHVGVKSVELLECL